MKLLFTAIIVTAILAFPSKINALAYTAEPTKIIIPSLNLTLPVHKANVIFGTWEVHLNGASFGDGTAIPGNLGNTAIFSHARGGLFGDLPTIKKGAVIHVFTDSDWFVYKVESTFTVAPERIDVIKNSNTYELTLYTCVGYGWSERFIVKAKLLSNPATLLD